MSLGCTGTLDQKKISLFHQQVPTRTLAPKWGGAPTNNQRWQRRRRVATAGVAAAAAHPRDGLTLPRGFQFLLRLFHSWKKKKKRHLRGERKKERERERRLGAKSGRGWWGGSNNGPTWAVALKRLPPLSVKSPGAREEANNGRVGDPPPGQSGQSGLVSACHPSPPIITPTISKGRLSPIFPFNFPLTFICPPTSVVLISSVFPIPEKIEK